jgi:hypothetical protein
MPTALAYDHARGLELLSKNREIHDAWPDCSSHSLDDRFAIPVSSARPAIEVDGVKTIQFIAGQSNSRPQEEKKAKPSLASPSLQLELAFAE